MQGSRHGTECPHCDKGVLRRRRRNFWMRLVPRSKYYLCDLCPARYLTVYGRPIRLFLQGK